MTKAEMLTWQEMQDGVPCRACGRPWDERGLPADPEADAAFSVAHKGGGRHALAGCQTVHCLACCPPPPLSPDTIDRVVALLRSMAP